MSTTRLTHEFFLAAGAPDAERSSVWHIWNVSGQEDVYVAQEGLRNVFKVSFHRSGQLHLGFATEFVRKHGPKVGGSSIKFRNRLLRKWAAAEVDPAVQVVFRIGLPTEEFGPCRPSSNLERALFLPAAPVGQMHEVGFLLVAPSFVPRGGRGTIVAWNHTLPSGKLFSVWSKAVPYGDSIRAQVAAARRKLADSGFAPRDRMLVGGETPDGVQFVVEAAGPQGLTS